MAAVKRHLENLTIALEEFGFYRAEGQTDDEVRDSVAAEYTQTQPGELWYDAVREMLSTMDVAASRHASV